VGVLWRVGSGLLSRDDCGGGVVDGGLGGLEEATRGCLRGEGYFVCGCYESGSVLLENSALHVLGLTVSCIAFRVGYDGEELIQYRLDSTAWS
jgi:hypothetical protein